jgi:hypothetical protein
MGGFPIKKEPFYFPILSENFPKKNVSVHSNHLTTWCANEDQYICIHSGMNLSYENFLSMTSLLSLNFPKIKC